MKYVFSKLVQTILIVLMLPIILSATIFAATDITTVSSDLVLYYSFDDASVSDISGNNNNGSLNGTTIPVNVSGINENALLFNGSGYSQTPDSTSINFGTGDFSVSYWIKTTKSSQTVFDKRGSNSVGYHGYIINGYPLLQLNDPQKGFYNYFKFGTKTVNDGNWHFVTFTVDRDSTSGVDIYVDGKLQAELNATYRTGNLDNTSNLLIGKHADGQIQLDGSIDEFMLFNKSLSSQEVNTLYALTQASTSDMMFCCGQSVSVGDSLSVVLSRFGNPSRMEDSPYGYQWYIYNQDYSNYVQIGIANGEVVALCSNASNLAYKNSLTPGSTKSQVRDVFGIPSSSGTTKDSFLSNGFCTNVYYDSLNNDSLSAVEIYKYPLPSANFTDAVSRGIEKQVFDFANAFRVRNGMNAFIWSDLAAISSRKHSVDMAQRNFFSHNNPDGLSPFDRMSAEGIMYRMSGENIAAGQPSSIAAHEGWINSSGHRSNILNTFDHLGVGFYFGGPYGYYYTQNFYKPM